MTTQDFNHSDLHKKWEEHHKHHSNPIRRVLFGFVLVIGGTLAILGKTNMIDPYIFSLIFNWQVLLITIGLLMLTNRHKGIGGFILITIGAAFLLPKFIDVEFNTHQLLWPAIIIAVGLMVIFKGNKQWHRNIHKAIKKGDIKDKDMVNDNHVFGGGDFIFTSDNFKGGKISALFGGGKYDFSRSKLNESLENVLEVSLVFGGIELIVPADWNVKVEVDAIFGGFSNKKSEFNATAIDNNRQLIIRGSAVFGGGEIKRV